jgi:hypothetical protein
MSNSWLIFKGMMVGFFALILSTSFVFGQTDQTGNSVKQVPPASQTPAAIVNPQTMAEFEARIQQVRENAVQQIEALQNALQSRTGNDQETYLRQIEEVKKNAEISILELRRDQEMARGNTELAAQFQQAVDTLRNPPPRQAPNPQADLNRLEQLHTISQRTTQ